MNSSQSRSKRLGSICIAAFAVLVLVSADASNTLAQGHGKGLDTEWGFTFEPVKAKALKAPAYVQPMDGKVVASDAGENVILEVGVSGGESRPSGKVKRPGGIAIAPAGFGSYAGQIFVLAPEGGDEKAPCAVHKIDKSGAVSVFAKLPDAGSLNAGKPTECRDMEFGPAGSAFAGKLYAITNGNAAIYQIDPSGKASTFGKFDKPLAWEIDNLGFTPARDPKAPNAMLVSARPRNAGGARFGRIAIIGPDGKMSDNPYLVGFIRPTGFAFAPDGFGSYGGVFFIADAGKWASENKGEHDGRVLRVYKGVAREYATGMVDPTCLKFVGRSMLICDPAAHGKEGSGALLTIAPMY